MQRSFNSPWVGALATDLSRPDPAEAGTTMPAPAMALAPMHGSPMHGSPMHRLPMPGDRYDEIDLPAEAAEPDAEAWAARDRTIYQIGFKLLMGIAAAVGLSMAMVLRS